MEGTEDKVLSELHIKCKAKNISILEGSCPSHQSFFILTESLHYQARITCSGAMMQQKFSSVTQ